MPSNYEYLSSMWTLSLFSRGCDICKDFWLEILARRENRGRLTLTVKDELSGLSWAMKTPWKSRQISKGYQKEVINKRRLFQTLIEMTSFNTVISSMLIGLFIFLSLTENQDARAKKKSFHNHQFK